MTCHDVLTHMLASLLKGPVLSALPLSCEHGGIRYGALKLGFHIRGKRKRLAAAVCGCGMRYANDLIPYIRLPMRLHSLFLSE